MYGKSLAHIEKIKAVHSIDGADKIERVTVLDWNLVAKKGEFSPGDLALYVEIGSILPDGLEEADRDRYKELAKVLSEHKRRANAIRKATEKGVELPVFEDDLMPVADAEAEMAEIQSRSKYPFFEFLRPKKFKIKTIIFSKFDVISQGILFRPEDIGLSPEEVKRGGSFGTIYACTPGAKAEDSALVYSDTATVLSLEVKRMLTAVGAATPISGL